MSGMHFTLPPKLAHSAISDVFWSPGAIFSGMPCFRHLGRHRGEAVGLGESSGGAKWTVTFVQDPTDDRILPLVVIAFRTLPPVPLVTVVCHSLG